MQDIVKIRWIDYEGFSYIDNQDTLEIMVENIVIRKMDAVVHTNRGKMVIKEGKVISNTEEE